MYILMYLDLIGNVCLSVRMYVYMSPACVSWCNGLRMQQTYDDDDDDGRGENGSIWWSVAVLLFGLGNDRRPFAKSLCVCVCLSATNVMVGLYRGHCVVRLRYERSVFRMGSSWFSTGRNDTAASPMSEWSCYYLANP